MKSFCGLPFNGQLEKFVSYMFFCLMILGLFFDLVHPSIFLYFFLLKFVYLTRKCFNIFFLIL